MTQTLKYAGIGLLAYLIFMAWLFPAKLGYAWMGDDAADARKRVGVYGIEGTLLSGSASRLDVGDYSFRELKWNLAPSELLFGKLGVQVALRGDGSDAQFLIAKRFTGTTALEHVSGKLPMMDVLAMAKIPALKMGGVLDLDLANVQFAPGQLAALDGALVWRAAATEFPQQLKLGDVKAQFETTPQGVKGVISDGGGPLQAKGELLLAQDGKLTFKGTFSAREGPSSSLARSLSMFGRVDAEGKVDVAYNGNLADLGFVTR